MNSSESDAQRARKHLQLKAYIWRFSHSGRYQTGLSILVALAWIASHAHHDGRHTSPTLGSFGEYFGFLVGIAAILILASSMTIALLVYFFQVLKGDQNTFYGRFR